MENNELKQFGIGPEDIEVAVRRLVELRGMSPAEVDANREALVLEIVRHYQVTNAIANIFI